MSPRRTPLRRAFTPDIAGSPSKGPHAFSDSELFVRNVISFVFAMQLGAGETSSELHAAHLQPTAHGNAIQVRT